MKELEEIVGCNKKKSSRHKQTHTRIYMWAVKKEISSFAKVFFIYYFICRVIFKDVNLKRSHKNFQLQIFISYNDEQPQFTFP